MSKTFDGKREQRSSTLTNTKDSKSRTTIIYTIIYTIVYIRYIRLESTHLFYSAHVTKRTKKEKETKKRNKHKKKINRTFYDLKRK